MPVSDCKCEYTHEVVLLGVESGFLIWGKGSRVRTRMCDKCITRELAIMHLGVDPFVNAMFGTEYALKNLARKIGNEMHSKLRGNGEVT